MIATLRGLCEQLSARRLTVAEAAALLGTAGPESSGTLGVAVRPRDPAFASALIVRDAGGGFSHAELTLAQELRLADLAGAFGDPARPPRLHWNSPETRIFRVGGCRLIATLVNGERVASVKLQPAAPP